MLVFEERGKPEYPEKNLSEQNREPTTNSTHVRESNPVHSGGRRALLPLRDPCSPQIHQMHLSLPNNTGHIRILGFGLELVCKRDSCRGKSSRLPALASIASWFQASTENTNMVYCLEVAGLPQVRKWSGKKIFEVREKSGNFIVSQGKSMFSRKVREN